MTAVALPLALAACGGEPDATDSAATSPVTETAVDPASAAPTDDPTRTELTPDAERGETGARDVLLGFARAIELERFDEAYAMLGEADRNRWSRTEFAGFFADLEKITVAVPGGTMEGAAGSSYYMVPATITATDTAGVPVRYQGEIVLRRANDVPGATPEQLRWHIEHVELDRTH
ncbi:MAG: hypothetical protein ACO1OD_09290 [Croceibacterium sp.]